MLRVPWSWWLGDSLKPLVSHLTSNVCLNKLSSKEWWQSSFSLPISIPISNKPAISFSSYTSSSTLPHWGVVTLIQPFTTSFKIQFVYCLQELVERKKPVLDNRKNITSSLCFPRTLTHLHSTLPKWMYHHHCHRCDNSWEKWADVSPSNSSDFPLILVCTIPTDYSGLGALEGGPVAPVLACQSNCAATKTALA